MKKIFAILFENKIFSISPNYFGFNSILVTDPRIQKEGNEYFIIDPFYGENIVNSSDVLDIRNTIFQYDPMETYFRNERLKNYINNEVNLDFARKIITDDNYPAFKDHSLFYDEFVNDEGFMVQNERFYMNGGRSLFLKMIGEHRYSEALPEIREILLHDCKEIKPLAINVAGRLQRKKADEIVNEVLGITDDKYLIMDICHYISAYSLNNLFLPNLRKKWEEFYLDYVDKYLSVKYFHTVPQTIILTCSHILSIEAVSLIEEGIRHPYGFVEKNSIHAISSWIKNVIKNKSNDEKLIKKVIELSKKYDIPFLYKNGKFLQKKIQLETVEI